MKYLITLFLLSACDLKQQYTLNDTHLVYQDMCPASEIMVGQELYGDGIWCARIQILDTGGNQ